MNRKNINRAFIIITLLFIIFFWLDTIFWYLSTHQYYFWFNKDWSYITELIFNKYTLLYLIWILISFIPISYLIFSKKTSFNILFFLIYIWVYWFALSFLMYKDTLVWSEWTIWLLINVIFIWILTYVFINWLLISWYLIKKYLFKQDSSDIFDVIMSFWLWLVAFILLNYIFILTKTFYRPISLIIFFWYIFLIYQYNSILKTLQSSLLEVFDWIKIKNLTKNYFNFIIILLIWLSILYFYFWFILSYIPYPTAWDANHAYLLFPKMFSENNWFYWSIWFFTGWKYLWIPYIAYWFSFMKPFSWFWISADTIAIEMNFLSWIFVLIFSLALIWELIKIAWSFLNKNNDVNDIKKGDSFEENYSLFSKLWFSLGWLLILSWLTSWMWAFLVFVDNKTDLWVLALIILAIYSWFVMLKKISDYDLLIENNISQNDIINDNDKNKYIFYWLINIKVVPYLLMSWIFFAVAASAKPTAMLDIVNFWTFLLSMWVWILWWIWIIICIIWLLWYIKFRWINFYMSSSFWITSLLIWIWLSFFSIFRSLLKKSFKGLSYILFWWLTIIITLMVIKWPFYVVRTLVNEGNLSPQNFLKNIFLWYDNTKGLDNSKNNDNEINNSNYVYANTCSIDQYTKEELYSTTKSVKWSSYEEDVWRYIWYWWALSWTNTSIDYDKVKISKFTQPIWWFLFPQSQEWECYWFYEDANVLCENLHFIYAENKYKKYSKENIQQTLEKLNKNSEWYKILSAFENSDQLSWKNVEKIISDSDLKFIYDSLIKEVESYYQNRSILSKTNYYCEQDWKILLCTKDDSYINKIHSVFIPYKYLTIFNMTYNWSLQNQSSYYTDSWFMLLILIWIVIISLIYWIFIRQLFLISLSMVTIWWWIIWFFIWWWILWYWIWLIIWTIISTVLFFVSLHEQDKKYEILWKLIFGILVLYSLFQISLWFMRMWWQWWAWPFLYYKQSAWIKQSINNNLEPITKIETPYTSESLFNIQFWHYKKYIEAMNNREEWIWSYLAWTYARYFINNQDNIFYDNFLITLRQRLSDWDTCKSYLRLLDKNIKYIAIDPNIWTVTIWQSNQTLFHRFFANYDKSSWEIKEDWSVTMLLKLKQEWYIDLFSTNNLWAKYAFTLSDKKYNEYLWYLTWWTQTLTWEQLILSRWKMAMTKYFDDAYTYINYIYKIFTDRMFTWEAVNDIADIKWKILSKEAINFAKKFVQWTINEEWFLQFNDFSDDEKLILYEYISLITILKSNAEDNQSQYQQIVSNMIVKNIKEWSQILVLEVK